MWENHKLPNFIQGSEVDMTENPKHLELYQVLREGCMDFQELIEKGESSVWLYQLSHARRQLLEWMEFRQGERILELGTQAGALTGLFLEKGAVVDGLEPNLLLAKCNAARYAEHKDFHMFAGTLQCAKEEWSILKENQYDTIVLVESLRNPQRLMGQGATQLQVLQMAVQYLKPGGRIIIALENRMGLKYWAGCKEQITGKYFGGIEGVGGRHSGGRTKRELEMLLTEAGLTKQKFYYPYPDEQFPNTIYSDDYLPGPGELRTNLRNYDTDRYVLFDEKKVYDLLQQEELYPQFANAFLVIAAKGNE